jgi:rod shape determining protein RodA
MALTFLSRRPDSGLGNIRSSPGDPSRNVDWVLMGTQALLTVIGCFVVYSASWTKLDADPYTFVNRQVVFAIVATVVMTTVMTTDYQFFKDHASFL